MNTPEERRLLRQILEDTSPGFLKWAIGVILKWGRMEKPTEIIHIHGSVDRVLPVKYVKADTVIPGGGHLMVYTMAKEVSQALADCMSHR